MKKDYTKEVLNNLREIHKSLGGNLGLHIAMATEGSKLDFLTDKELSYQLEKYLNLKELDIDSQLLNFEDEDYEEDF